MRNTTGKMSEKYVASGRHLYKVIICIVNMETYYIFFFWKSMDNVTVLKLFSSRSESLQ